MSQRILLITGWGGGTKLLEPLKLALQQQSYQVDLINIFDAFDLEVLQQYVENAKTYDVIAGWSLGGQLATILVDQVSKQFNEQKVLVTLASNPCFVANVEWQTAMPQAAFQGFKQSFEQDAIATLKKFGFMVCQGVETTKQDFITLQSLIQPQPLQLLKQGLNCLEQFNNVDILKKYAGHQYHLFAKQDFLVSYKIQGNLLKLDASFFEFEFVSGSHGFPVFNFEFTSSKIIQYLQKIK